MKKLFIIFICFFVDIAFANNGGIKANSQNMELDFLKKIASYKGEVLVISGNYRVECGQMDVFFAKKNEQKDAIERILFIKDVIFAGENKVVNADNAEYKADERKVYFWGNVKAKELSSYLEADKAVYDLNKELISVVGEESAPEGENKRVRIIIEDKKDENSKSG